MSFQNKQINKIKRKSTADNCMCKNSICDKDDVSNCSQKEIIIVLGRLLNYLGGK